jgi:hypothetical protein
MIKSGDCTTSGVSILFWNIVLEVAYTNECKFIFAILTQSCGIGRMIPETEKVSKKVRVEWAVRIVKI